MANRVWVDAAIVRNATGHQEDTMVRGVKELTRMQDWNRYWGWEKDDKHRSRHSGAEPFRGRGALRVLSHPTSQDATILPLCCGSRVLGCEGAGCITSHRAPVHESPWKMSYGSYELNTCHYTFITGIFLPLHAEQTESFSCTFYSSGRTAPNKSNSPYCSFCLACSYRKVLDISIRYRCLTDSFLGNILRTLVFYYYSNLKPTRA